MSESLLDVPPHRPKAVSDSAHARDDGLQSLHTTPPSTSSQLFHSVWNYANLVVGNALVALPHTLDQAGLAVGLAMVVVVAALSGLTTYKLARAGHMTRHMSYEDLATFCFGPVGHYTAIIAIVLNDYGSMVLRCVVIGDVAGPIYRSWLPSLTRAQTVVVGCSLVALPLAFTRHFKSLSASSLASFVANLAIIALLLYETGLRSSAAVVRDLEQSLVPHGPAFRAFGIVCFLFANQEFSFQVFKGTGTTDRAQWQRVTVIGLVLAVVVCALMAVSGLLAFGEDVESDVLENFPDDSLLANVMRVVCCFIVLSGYPMDLFICRRMLACLLGLDPDNMPTVAHATLTTFLFAATLGMGAYLDDLGLVQSVVGSVCGVVIGFVLPSACVLQANRVMQGGAFVSWTDPLLVLTAVVGVVACAKAIYACVAHPGDDSYL